MTMFLAAGLSLNQTGASLAGYSEEQQLATEAAQAGVDYAKTRLQEFPDWKGGTGDSVVVDMPGQLWVRENRGNVIGIVGEGDRKCAFGFALITRMGAEPRTSRCRTRIQPCLSPARMFRPTTSIAVTS